MWMDSAAHKAQKRNHTKYDISKKVKTESSGNDDKEALNYIELALKHKGG